MILGRDEVGFGDDEPVDVGVGDDPVLVGGGFCPGKNVGSGMLVGQGMVGMPEPNGPGNVGVVLAVLDGCGPPVPVGFVAGGLPVLGVVGRGGVVAVGNWFV